MTQVLLFNIEGKKSIDIKMICHKLHIGAVTVDKHDFNKKIASIIGLSDDNSENGAGEFDEEMLLFVGFNNTYLDIMLSQLRQKKSRVDLKAVLTETNKNFTPFELYNELKAEREAIENGTQLHQT